jgi:hypothetical protein
MDHDQRLKVLLQEFFADFLALFFGLWAERLDTSAVAPNCQRLRPCWDKSQVRRISLCRSAAA